MNEQLNQLIQAMRDELQQYSEMLSRLDRHRQSPKDARAFSGEVWSQCAAIQRARHHREQACREVFEALHLNVVVSIEEIIPSLPVDFQPLVNELAQGNRHLMEQVVESLQRK